MPHLTAQFVKRGVIVAIAAICALLFSSSLIFDLAPGSRAGESAHLAEQGGAQGIPCPHHGPMTPADRGPSKPIGCPGCCLVIQIALSLPLEQFVIVTHSDSQPAFYLLLSTHAPNKAVANGVYRARAPPVSHLVF